MHAPDEKTVERQSATGFSAHVSPAMRVDRHALESIFAMLQMQDLIQTLAVSRLWATAVRSMKPILARIERDYGVSFREQNAFRPLASISSIAASPLLRHIAALHVRGKIGLCTPLDNASLGLLVQHAPNLTSLWCNLTLTPNVPPVLPVKLTILDLQLGDDCIWTAATDKFTDAEVNGVLTALAALPSLSCIRLRLCAFQREASVEWSILAASPSLTDLTLYTAQGNAPNLSHTQVDQIRLSLGHLQRFNLGWIHPDILGRFLQPPVTARWRDVGQLSCYERTGDLLLTLPTLTKLDLKYMEDTANVDFLAQLPLLTVLSLSCSPLDYHVDALSASLAACTGLTELSLSCGFDSAHWSALFNKLPMIRKLSIDSRGRLETLRCFAAGPITQSLEDLTIRGELPPSELSHLSGLRRLRTLHLEHRFSSRLDDATIDSVSPPTPLLPALTKFFYQWCAGEWDSQQRRGPSFEWMQSLK